jgi:hypothetical protein
MVGLKKSLLVMMGGGWKMNRSGGTMAMPAKLVRVKLRMLAGCR